MPKNVDVMSIGQALYKQWKKDKLDDGDFKPTTEEGWNQIVDAIDNDFLIEHEQRMQDVNGFVTEGTIETRPTTGSTVFEPWHGDSTWGFQRWYATLQSIRRRASVGDCYTRRTPPRRCDWRKRCAGAACAGKAAAPTAVAIVLPLVQTALKSSPLAKTGR